MHLHGNLYCSTISYVNGEVSADGHNWTMGGYATDYLEKNWPTSYGGRGGTYPRKETGRLQIIRTDFFGIIVSDRASVIVLMANLLIIRKPIFLSWKTISANILDAGIRLYVIQSGSISGSVILIHLLSAKVLYPS